jgi:uncharacterized membrane protein (DUF2068 family)
MTHLKEHVTPAHDAGLIAIAVFKLVKGVALIALGLGAFRLLDRATVDRLTNWLLHFSLSTGKHFVDRLIDVLSQLTGRRVAALGLGAVAYGSLFLVEGTGLWRGKRWAEYLTVITTGLLIPVEIFEIVRRPTFVRVSALVINVGAVVYLVYRLRHPRDASHNVGTRSRETAGRTPAAASR